MIDRRDNVARHDYYFSTEVILSNKYYIHELFCYCIRSSNAMAYDSYISTLYMYCSHQIVKNV